MSLRDKIWGLTFCLTLFSHSPLLMPISLLGKNVPFVIILIELNMGGVYYQNNSTLSDVQKLSLLFSNKLCFVLDSVAI